MQSKADNTARINRVLDCIEARLEVTDRTAAPRWEGDRMDYDWVLMWMPPPEGHPDREH